MWMVCSRGAREFDYEHEGHEFESLSLHLKPETKTLVRKVGFLVVQKGIRTVWLAQARHC